VCVCVCVCVCPRTGDAEVSEDMAAAGHAVSWTVLFSADQHAPFIIQVLVSSSESYLFLSYLFIFLFSC
jgi:hypothetical protein